MTVERLDVEYRREQTDFGATYRQRRQIARVISTPAEIMLPVRQIPEALSGNLKYRIADRGLD
jgi:hypothetical protein